MANDQFYGKKRKPAKTKGNPGNVDLEFESVNPYEFKKGMNYELNKLGVLSLHESSEEDREKATESVIKNLKETPAYYSYLEHYETTTRNMDRKPSFKTFLKELDGYSMKEVKEKFDNDKMKEIKLKESIRAEVRNKINELLGSKKLSLDESSDLKSQIGFFNSLKVGDKVKYNSVEKNGIKKGDEVIVNSIKSSSTFQKTITVKKGNKKVIVKSTNGLKPL